MITFTETDAKKLTDLLEHKDYAEAKKILTKFFNQEMTPAEKGKIYANVLSVYLTVTNKVNALYLKDLEKTAQVLKDLRTDEKQTKDKVKMLDINRKLAGFEDDGL